MFWSTEGNYCAHNKSPFGYTKKYIRELLQVYLRTSPCWLSNELLFRNMREPSLDQNQVSSWIKGDLYSFAYTTKNCTSTLFIKINTFNFVPYFSCPLDRLHGLCIQISKIVFKTTYTDIYSSFDFRGRFLCQ